MDSQGVEVLIRWRLSVAFPMASERSTVYLSGTFCTLPVLFTGAGEGLDKYVGSAPLSRLATRICLVLAIAIAIAIEVLAHSTMSERMSLV